MGIAHARQATTARAPHTISDISISDISDTISASEEEPS